ncbi:MAG TPA: hypothetical protein VJU82_08055 [Acidobacteriaceae bacterium]|nr:hypothetical protein [Acidobacteriaceae bacterium]
MRRVMLWVLLLSAGGVAQASGRHEKWDPLRNLAQGTQVLVKAGDQPMPEFCEVVAVDDSSLTCDRVRDPEANWTPASGARLMFPRTGVKNVWVWEEDHRISVGMWIGIVLSAGLEIAACVSGGGVGCAAMAGFLAITWATVACDPVWPQRPPRMRRRLVYRAPQVPAGSTATP